MELFNGSFTKKDYSRVRGNVERLVDLNGKGQDRLTDGVEELLRLPMHERNVCTTRVRHLAESVVDRERTAAIRIGTEVAYVERRCQIERGNHNL